MVEKSESESCSVVSDSLQSHGLYSKWNSPGQNTGVGSLSLLQGIFPTQGLNPGLPHCRLTLYQLNQKGSPRIPEWVAYPFSRGYSWPRNWTRVSCTAGRFFTNWAMGTVMIVHRLPAVSQRSFQGSAALSQTPGCTLMLPSSLSLLGTICWEASFMTLRTAEQRSRHQGAPRVYKE